MLGADFAVLKRENKCELLDVDLSKAVSSVYHEEMIRLLELDDLRLMTEDLELIAIEHTEATGRIFECKRSCLPLSFTKS
jgi:hypothetical protein